MTDNPAATDKPAPPQSTGTELPGKFDSYIFPTTETPARTIEQPLAGTKDVKDLTVTPIQTPGWKAPDATTQGTDAPKAPGSGADKNLDKTKVSEGLEDINQGQLNILNAAKEAVGKDLWKGTKYEGIVDGGTKAAAVSVTEVLKAAGISSERPPTDEEAARDLASGKPAPKRYTVDSAMINGVEQQMQNGPFAQKQLADASPGDIVVYQPNPGDSSKRIGIVGENNANGKPTIYQMNKTGTWSHHEMKVPPNAKVYTPGCGE